MTLRAFSANYFEVAEVNDDKSPTVLINEDIAAFTADVVVRHRWDDASAVFTAVEDILIFRNISCVSVAASNQFVICHFTTSR